MKESKNTPKGRKKNGGKKAGNAAAKQVQSPGEGDSILAGLRQEAEEYLKDPGRLDEAPAQESKQAVRELGTCRIEPELQGEGLRKRQAELKESRRRFADLYDFVPVGYFSLDPQGKIISVNQAGASMLGTAKSKIEQRPFAHFIAKEDRDAFNLFIHRVLREESRQIAELRLQKKEGESLHGQLEGIPVRHDAGEVIELRISVSDISRRILAEHKLQRKSSLLRAIVDATDVMLVYLDPAFNFLWVNPAYARVCNMTAEELAGKNHFALFPHRENEWIFRRVKESGEPVFFKDKPFEFPEQPERGVTYWDWSLVPVKDPEGKVTALVFSLRETTKYKQAELELAESEERFRRIAETSSDIIFQLASDGMITYVSPAVRALGHTPDQVQGRFFSDFISADEQARAMKAFSLVNSGKHVSLELQVLKADGTAAECEISAAPVTSEGFIVGVQGITRDITERKRTESILRRSEAQLRTILNKLAEGVIVSDLAGNLVYWNPTAIEIHGFTSEVEYLRALREFDSIFELTTPEEGVLAYERWPLSRILQGESLRACEVTIRRLDTDWERIFRYSGTLARDTEGNPLLAVLTLADITERKQAEKRIRNNNALLQGIKEIFEAGLVCETDEELASASLRVAEKITGSRFGFIGEIGTDGLLHDIAVSNPGWQECGMDDQSGHRRPSGNFKIAGLYGQVLAEGVPFFTNDPLSHPAMIGTPAGHPSLTSFLGVPLIYREKTIGLIALANRVGRYGAEELESVQALAPAFVETLFKSRTERALRESEARESARALQFQQFFDFTPIPVWIAHDPECRKITRNLAAARLVGLDPDLNGSPSAPGEEKVPQVQVFRKGKKLAPDEMPLRYAITHGTRVDDEEIDIIPASGKARRMLGTAAPLYDADGQVRGGIAAYMDITERKRMEEQLLQAKQEWEKTFDAVPDLITILDPQHRIVRVNRAMAEKMDMTQSKCMGNFCFNCVHNTSYPVDECPNIRTLRDGRQHMAEVHEERLGGDFLVTTTPIFDEQGEIKVTVHVARDITQVKETARLLQESEDRLNRGQRIAHLGSWELDIDRNVLTWSDEVFRIFGMEPQSFVPCYEDFLRSIHPDDREKVHNIYMDSLRGGKAGYEIEHRIIQKSTGRIRYVHEKCEHFRDENGKVVRSGGMVHDITERNEAEKKILILNNELERNIRQLAISNKELERSNEDLQQYAYIISHDLQEPLRSVSSFVQLLSRRYQGKLDAKADTFINFAVEGAAHMQRLLTDLLRFSRVGGGELHLGKVSLESVLQKTMHHLKNAIEESGALIESESLPVVLADEMQLNTLLQNLISNALKFRGEEPPRVHISAKREAHQWTICVRDNGIGIDPRFAERIFLIFQRLHRRDEYSGTGIGLAICKKVVERHGGHLWVESAPGKGAAFYFSLPAGEGEERTSPLTLESFRGLAS
jgi:PAS domain S-box-containing protein